ncbi:DNA-binding protein [uncultured archaeon]|nr:DNA-binding protein [uncultured archaeon]
MPDELEELRKRRMQEYAAVQQQAIEQQAGLQQQAAELQAQLKMIMPQILSPVARQRIANIRVAKPDFAMQIELYLVQLFQAGQIKRPLTDAELRAILDKLVQKKETKIIRR